jgi:hypothetical protein
MENEKDYIRHAGRMVESSFDRFPADPTFIRIRLYRTQKALLISSPGATADPWEVTSCIYLWKRRIGFIVV